MRPFLMRALRTRFLSMQTGRRTRWLLILASAVVLFTGQRGMQVYLEQNPGYNGLFTFTRIRYGGFGGGRGGGSWAHDYPRGDQHLSIILRELTMVRASVNGTNVFTLDDPELFKYPIAYISEPGFWSMNEAEERNLAEYIARGGFLIFDDFEHEHLNNVVYQMRRVLPDLQLIELKPDDEIFDSFFKINDIYVPHPMEGIKPTYYAIFEDNNPNKRMIAIVNHNADLAEYWEWSGQGWWPVDMSNEAYKIGVNYIVYALTH
jgi:hypothetical protein